MSSPAVRQAASRHARTEGACSNRFGHGERSGIHHQAKHEQGASRRPSGHKKNKKKNRPPALASPVLDRITGPLERGENQAGVAAVAAAEQLVGAGAGTAGASHKAAVGNGDKVNVEAGLSSNSDAG